MGQALYSVEKDRLAKEARADHFSPLGHGKLGGRASLSYDYLAGGKFYTRHVVTSGLWMITFTIWADSEQLKDKLEPVMDSVRLQPFPSVRPANPVKLTDQDKQNIKALIERARRDMDSEPTWESAANDFSQVINLDPVNTTALFNLTMVRLRQGNPGAAATRAKQLLNIDPNDSAAWNLLGLAQRDQNKPKEAVESFREAIRANPKHAGAHYNLGVTCASRLHDINCAKQSFRQFLTIEPSGSRAGKVRDWLNKNGG